MVKILHITNNDYDGAGLAAKRLNNSLNKIKIESKLLVLYKRSNDQNILSLGTGKSFKELLKLILLNFFLVELSNYKELIKLFIFRSNNIFKNLIYKPASLFNFNDTVYDINHIIPHLKNLDFLILHSIQDIISIETISKIHKLYNLKIVFHPLDMEMITGGYHFSYDCDCYKLGYCNSKKHNLNKLAEQSYKTRLNYLSHLPIKWITTSNFMQQRVKESKMFHKSHSIDTVYMGIAEKEDNNFNKEKARQILGLNQKNKIMLFGCFDFSDPRKGANLLREIMIKISPIIQNEPLSLITYGSLKNFSFGKLNFEWKHFGSISHEKLKILYKASDLMLSPSIDDIGPTTVQEAFYYNLPVIGFDIGFVSDFIFNEVNGKKIECFNKNKFAEAILEFIKNDNFKKNVNDPIINDLRTQCYFYTEARLFLHSIKKS